jgi:hypothetical protein
VRYCDILYEIMLKQSRRNKIEFERNKTTPVPCWFLLANQNNTSSEPSRSLHPLCHSSNNNNNNSNNNSSVAR